MSKHSSAKLKIIFLGGVGEIGKNMTALQYGDDIIVVDAGLSFPNTEEMPGIDYVIPDFGFLAQNKDKVRGVMITHGHEDHIGALPFLMRELRCPVYGSSLTLGLVEHKLKEHRLSDKVKRKVIKDCEVVEAGCFKVEFVRVTHSIAGSYALSITTPKGVVFFTGDFKIDHTPIDFRPIDLNRIAAIGNAGVLLMLQDSTNVERPGFSMSEKNVGKSLDTIFAQNTNKRMIIATFASNVHRVQQIINCALKYNRKIAFSGRSMINIAEIAHNLKVLNYPLDKIVDIEKTDGIPYDRLCIITTGTQGEPESALTRMAQDDFKKISINSKDTVVLSSSPIPGNEKLIYNVINNLCKRGAYVVYESLSEVHVSGHACREELKMMMSLLKPRFFIPIHGEYRHLQKHKYLAMEMGIPEGNILIPELGFQVEVGKKGLTRLENVHAGAVMLDGSVAQDNTDVLLRDRKHLAEDGLALVIANVSADGELTEPPAVIMRGLSVSDAILDEIRDGIAQRAAKGAFREIDGNERRAVIRKATAKILFARLKKRPMVIPITIED